eukprot:CAMPEP_0170550680 /NCGR_PEP_ID=MMETSP0211-20121228/8694_1 /TAXON_ID=311385 /ORGANISM="Pseudokeronopsis sp., Strain OXSARD2" /LENGTH=67 /DNA_ID=CAMNT_0010857335 /DNA_START=149 /DNA_END=352 /DNA_ORIENTATION=+
MHYILYLFNQQMKHVTKLKLNRDVVNLIQEVRKKKAVIFTSNKDILFFNLSNLAFLRKVNIKHIILF